MDKSHKVLITGGGGYIGSVLTVKMLEKGYLVTVLDNFKFGDMGTKNLREHSNITIVNGDIRDASCIDKSLENVVSVIHLAAISDGVSGREDPKITNEVNHEAFAQIIEKARDAGVKRFIQASTFGVYGNKYKQALTENLPVNPAEPYSISKAKSEIIAKQFNSDFFTTTSIRSAMVCGVSPRMRFDFIVNKLTYKALSENKISIWGGQQRRPQIHIDDITDYFIELLEAPSCLIAGEIFNAGGQNVSLMDIAEVIKNILGQNIKIEILPYRANEESFILNSDKIFRVLKLNPQKDVSDAVKDIATSYKEGRWNDFQNDISHNPNRMKV